MKSLQPGPYWVSELETQLVDYLLTYCQNRGNGQRITRNWRQQDDDFQYDN